MRPILCDTSVSGHQWLLLQGPFWTIICIGALHYLVLWVWSAILCVFGGGGRLVRGFTQLFTAMRPGTFSNPDLRSFSAVYGVLVFLGLSTYATYYVMLCGASAVRLNIRGLLCGCTITRCSCVIQTLYAFRIAVNIRYIRFELFYEPRFFFQYIYIYL